MTEIAAEYELSTLAVIKGVGGGQEVTVCVEC